MIYSDVGVLRVRFPWWSMGLVDVMVFSVVKISSWWLFECSFGAVEW